MKYLVKQKVFRCFEEAEIYQASINYPVIHCGEPETLALMSEKNRSEDKEVMSFSCGEIHTDN